MILCNKFKFTWIYILKFVFSLRFLRINVFNSFEFMKRLITIHVTILQYSQHLKILYILYILYIHRSRLLNILKFDRENYFFQIQFKTQLSITISILLDKRKKQGKILTTTSSKSIHLSIVSRYLISNALQNCRYGTGNVRISYGGRNGV